MTKDKCEYSKFEDGKFRKTGEKRYYCLFYQGKYLFIHTTHMVPEGYRIDVTKDGKVEHSASCIINKRFEGLLTDEERKIAARNMQWYETLLRKQKVLDFLNAL